jgi:hypothetical protein
MFPLGRSAWSLKIQESTMAVGLGSRQAADEEARAEVEVLNSRLEKTRILNTKLAASLSRLEGSGKSVQEAIGPLYGNTQRLQVLGTSMCLKFELERNLFVDRWQISTLSFPRSRGLDNLPTSRAMRRTSSGKGQHPLISIYRCS